MTAFRNLRIFIVALAVLSWFGMSSAFGDSANVAEVACPSGTPLAFGFNGVRHCLQGGESFWLDHNGGMREAEELDELLLRHASWVGELGCVGNPDAGDIREDGRRLKLSDISIKRFVETARGQFENRPTIDLTNRDLRCAELTSVSLQDVDFTNANMFGALLDGNFAKARFHGTNLEKARMRGVFQYADITGARLIDTNMQGVTLNEADLTDAVYEPRYPPLISELARTQGLDTLRYENNPARLYELKEKFAESGYHRAERKIIAALRRMDANLLDYLAFDLTSEYGSNPARPAYFLMASLPIFAALYWIVLRLPAAAFGGELLLLVERKPGHPGYSAAEKHYVRKLPFAIGGRGGLDRTMTELRVLRLALIVSILSATRIGFRDLDLNKWLRLLQQKEYSFYLRGWPRTLSGLQSVLSVYLLALAILCVFGKPFDF
ncbi:MAG: pentapeptide repeat-containing protein [Alphaproteobacteria bacterium]|nr:pentapeptide repeat-containing protein [Alphaproteobacteria bacterium]